MIAGVGEIVEKTGPVNDVVGAINEQLDAGVDLLEGLLVKKAGGSGAVSCRPSLVVDNLAHREDRLGRRPPFPNLEW